MRVIGGLPPNACVLVMVVGVACGFVWLTRWCGAVEARPIQRLSMVRLNRSTLPFLGASRAGAEVFDAELGQGVAPQEGPVAAAVVGQHGAHGDVVDVEAGGARRQTGGGFTDLVVVDLAVGEPGVVIDRGVHVGVAAQRAVSAAACRRGLVSLQPLSAPCGPVATQTPGTSVFVQVRPRAMSEQRHRIHGRVMPTG